MQGFYYFLDDPAHPRLRSIVSTTFTPRIVLNFRERIQQIADELLDASLGARGEAEFMGEVSYPMTIRVITEILGATGEEDQRFFHEHALALAGLLEWDAPAERGGRGRRVHDGDQQPLRGSDGGPRERASPDLISSLIAARGKAGPRTVSRSSSCASCW